LDWTAKHAARVFYAGDGKVCAVTDLVDESSPVNSKLQNYSCEGNPPGLIDDPYEGELDVTSYSVILTMLFDKGVAFAWWKDMVDARKCRVGRECCKGSFLSK
jgi:hypothetical protein